LWRRGKLVSKGRAFQAEEYLCKAAPQLIDSKNMLEIVVPAAE
jgi:hypothetical protein